MVPPCDKPNRKLSMQLLSTLHNILASFSLLFWLHVQQLNCFGSLSQLSSAPFPDRAGRVLIVLINPMCATCPAPNSTK